MPLSMPLQHQRDEVYLLSDFLEGEPWQPEEHEELRATYWEYLVDRGLWFVAICDRTWQTTCEEIVAKGLDQEPQLEKLLRDIFDQTILVFRKVHTQGMDFVHKTGHTLKRLEELAAALQDLERKREQCLFRLSFLNEAIIDQARAEYGCGDYPSSGVALADLLAARHAAHITPSYPELRRWAESSPPPQSWYEEGDISV